VYKLTYKKSVKKELDAIPSPDFIKIDEAILALKEQPVPHPQSEKLKGEDRYRLRVGDYRVVYLIDEKQKMITILAAERFFEKNKKLSLQQLLPSSFTHLKPTHKILPQRTLVQRALPSRLHDTA